MTELLDNLDLKLLRELDKNSKTSLAILAKRLKTPTETLRYRLAKLKTKDVINKFVALVDGQSLGFEYHLLALKLKNCSADDIQSICRHLRKSPNTCWLADSDNEYQLLVKVRASNSCELKEFISSFFDEFNTKIADWMMSSQVDFIHLSRGYLTNRAHPRIELNSPKSSGTKLELDQIDRKILLLLGQNALMNNKELARLLPVADDAVRLRIKRLEEIKVIKRYSYLLSDGLEQISQYFIALRCHAHNRNDENKFLISLLEANVVVQITKLVGAWDYLLFVELPEKDNIQQLAMTLESKVPNFIANTKKFSLAKFEHNVSF